MHNIIELLQRKQLIWQGSEQDTVLKTQPSFFSEWDAQLQGFPKTGVVEVQSPIGIGEFRLFTPLMKEVGQQRIIVLINPPATPSAHYFEKEGINPSNVLVIRQSKHNLWAAEQCLKGGCSALVYLWHSQLEIHQVRRLQIAAEQGQALNIHFNLDRQNTRSLPIPLSVILTPIESGIEVKVNKRRGGWNHQPFTVDFSQRWPQLSIDKPNSQVIQFPLHKRHQA